MSTKSKLIRLKSSDQMASLSTNNGDFTVQLKDQTSMQGVTSVAIVEAYIPNVFYNVRSSQGVVNNVLRFKETGQAVLSATINEGQYTVATFMAALKVSFDATAVSQTITITQDPISQKLILTTSGSCILYSDADDALSTMASVLGLQITAASSSVHTMDSIPNLRGYSDLYIHCKAIADGNLIDGNSGDISTAIGVSLTDTAFGGMGYKQVATQHEGEINFPRSKNISNLRVVLRDAEGNKLDPGSSSITLLFKAVLG